MLSGRVPECVALSVRYLGAAKNGRDGDEKKRKGRKGGTRGKRGTETKRRKETKRRARPKTAATETKRAKMGAKDGK